MVIFLGQSHFLTPARTAEIRTIYGLQLVNVIEIRTLLQRQKKKSRRKKIFGILFFDQLEGSDARHS